MTNSKSSQLLTMLPGILLVLASVCGIWIANSSLYDLYSKLLNTLVGATYNKNYFSISIQDWCNEFLMSIFFLFIGIGIRIDIANGSLKNISNRVCAIITACCGVIVPIIIYSCFNFRDPIAMRAWAVPTATDIAFSVGILTLLGDKISKPLKMFVLTIAVVDDIIAIGIIAIFYGTAINTVWCLVSALLCMIFYILNLSKIFSISLYIVLGILLWLCILNSGLNPTMAGLIISMLLPISMNKHPNALQKLESFIEPYINYGILPLFAFMNTGVHFTSVILNIFNPIILGVSLGLWLGKCIGIFTPMYLMKKFHLIPFIANTRQILYAAISCGIGFTMSLFVSIVAFKNHPIYLAYAKIGVVFGFLLVLFTTLIIRICGNKND